MSESLYTEDTFEEENAEPISASHMGNNVVKNVTTSRNGSNSAAAEDVADNVTAFHMASNSFYELSSAFSPLFYTRAASVRYESLIHRNFVAEHKRKIDVFTRFNLTKFFEEKSLLKSVDYTSPFYRDIVIEFYANLEKEIWDKNQTSLGKFFLGLVFWTSSLS